MERRIFPPARLHFPHPQDQRRQPEQSHGRGVGQAGQPDAHGGQQVWNVLETVKQLLTEHWAGKPALALTSGS
jgi:hypothetical protein